MSRGVGPPVTCRDVRPKAFTLAACLFAFGAPFVNERRVPAQASGLYRCSPCSTRSCDDARLEGLPNARRSRWRAEGQTERKLQTRRHSMEMIELWKRGRFLMQNSIVPE